MESPSDQGVVRYVCAIDDGDTVLIIGGSVTGCCYYRDVERYNAVGLVETLPSLVINRNNHACTKYHNSAGEKVYMVVSGWTSSGYIDNTETLVEGGAAWTAHEGALPVGLGAPAVVTLNNIPHLFGGEVRLPAEILRLMVYLGG